MTSKVPISTEVLKSSSKAKRLALAYSRRWVVWNVRYSCDKGRSRGV